MSNSDWQASTHEIPFRRRSLFGFALRSFFGVIGTYSIALIVLKILSLQHYSHRSLLLATKVSILS